MSLVKNIQVGDHISHYGAYRPVTAKTHNDPYYTLTIQERGWTWTERTEKGTTNIPTLDNGVTAA